MSAPLLKLLALAAIGGSLAVPSRSHVLADVDDIGREVLLETPVLLTPNWRFSTVRLANEAGFYWVSLVDARWLHAERD